MGAKGTLIKKAFSHAPKAIGVAMPAYGAAIEYTSARQEGKNVVSSAMRAGMDFAIGEALGGPGYLLAMGVSALPNLAVNSYNAIDQMSRNMNSVNANTPFINSRFADTQQAYTMRQHGMQLAKASRYNLEQSLMGNEASHFKL